MNPKFLIVDDDEKTRELLKIHLEALECSSEGVESGARALEELLTKKRVGEFDAIFLDIMMPEQSGIAVLQKLREHQETASIPVILVTAMDRREEIIDSYKYGGSYFITKPFTREQIVYGLDLILGKEEEKTEDTKVYYSKY